MVPYVRESRRTKGEVDGRTFYYSVVCKEFCVMIFRKLKSDTTLGSAL